MAPPTYFFPRVTRDRLVKKDRLDREFLLDVGLARTFDDITSVQQQCSCVDMTGTGPSGASGCLLTAMPVSGDAPVRVGYHPKFQTWKAVMADRVWAGVDNEYPVTPDDIVRRKTRHGYQSEMQGSVWLIPIIRGPGGSTALESDWEWDEEGVVQETVAETWRDMWEAFVSVQEMLFRHNAVEFEMSRQEGGDRCIDAVSINYRFGPVEQNILKLINSDTWLTILMSAVDYPTFRAALVFDEQKKTTPDEADDSPPTVPGSEDCDPTTDQAEAS